MKKIKTKFKDLFVVKAKIFKDKRGWLKEEFKKKFIKKDLVFTLVSNSKKNVLRGLHMQTKKSQDKFLSVLKGKVLDVAVDLRKDSKTYGNFFSHLLKAENHESIFIPKGFAHGYLTLSEKAIINYKVDNYYNPTMERGISFEDSFLNIEWGVEKNKLVISEKDKKFESFKW